MHLVLIRHGEQDYTVTEGRGFPGPARELAPLTERGVAQAEAVVKDARLQGCQLIVSSPYTRALQTASSPAGSICPSRWRLTFTSGWLIPNTRTAISPILLQP